jgi:hypothetical protein
MISADFCLAISENGRNLNAIGYPVVILYAAVVRICFLPRVRALIFQHGQFQLWSANIEQRIRPLRQKFFVPEAETVAWSESHAGPRAAPAVSWQIIIQHSPQIGLNVILKEPTRRFFWLDIYRLASNKASMLGLRMGQSWVIAPGRTRRSTSGSSPSASCLHFTFWI